jgi:hypothetical protein
VPELAYGPSSFQGHRAVPDQRGLPTPNPALCTAAAQYLVTVAARAQGDGNDASASNDADEPWHSRAHRHDPTRVIAAVADVHAGAIQG